MERGYLQVEAEGRKFNEYGAREDEKLKEAMKARAAQQVEAAPAAYGEYYDPDDPNADWSGFVPKAQGRVHHKNPSAMKVQFGESEGGFLAPASTAPTSDWVRPGKRVISSHDQNSNPNAVPVRNQMASTQNLLGGLGGDYNRFETEAQAASRAALGQGTTTMDQLTQKGRSRHVMGKKPVEAMYETDMRGGGYNSQMGSIIKQENPYDIVKNGGRTDWSGLNNGGNSAQYNDGSDNDNLVGFRYHQGGHMKSMVNGLGKDVAAALVRPTKRNVVSAPFATDPSAPTDPYANASGGRSKDLFVENYNAGGQIPGFTGKRR
ncbi:hypothetical protein TrST_g3136 [Triparma strigata]|uniref:Uncharacterized protein n=1 Tax=Triparma strigata TaxID=1606541 RepID=A0A9W7F3Q4_9STRA|nr:hypothetical protein TrST_g3136 [Triparma strigata]